MVTHEKNWADEAKSKISYPVSITENEARPRDRLSEGDKTAPIRVLYLIDAMRMGGAERITVALLRHLDRSRFTPVICTLNTKEESPLIEQLDVKRYNLEAKRLLDPIAFRRLIEIIRQERVAVIHAQLQDATIFAAAVKRFTRVPIVVTRHLIDDDEKNWRRRMRNRLEQFTIHQSVEKMITVSEAAKQNYLEKTNLPRDRVETIYNGINLDNFRPTGNKNAVRQHLNLPHDKPIVTMVGVMRPGKGHAVCIEAARHVPEARFLLVGDGELRYELEQQAQDLTDRLHFLGQRLDIPDILRASDIFVLPSEMEALPTVLLEAGAVGLPCIASHVGGIPEIIQDGETGLLIPPHNATALAAAIQKLIDQPKHAYQMGQRALEFVREQFDLLHQVKATMNLYERLTRQFQ